MAELTPQDRLQPSLLDRLTDDEPDVTVESREKRVLSLKRLRESVLRDLTWLLNTGNLTQTDDLDDFPEAARSTINFGMVDMAGRTLSGANLADLERRIQQAIWDFEPRILRDTVRVRAVTALDPQHRNAIAFEIEGELWAQPVPLRLFLKSEIDLEDGSLSVVDQGDAGAA